MSARFDLIKRYEIEKLIKSTDFNSKNHVFTPSDFNPFFHSDETSYLTAIKCLISAPDKNHAILVDNIECHLCGTSHNIYFDGKEKYAESECTTKKEAYSVTIPVPSGILVVSDFLGYFLNLPDRDINKYHGLVATTHDYAKQNYFHSFVGNTCPSIIQKNKQHVKIGNFATNTKSYKGFVSTDVWWTTAVDFEILKNTYIKHNAIEAFQSLIEENCVLIYVTPGTYECTSYYPAFHTQQNLYNEFKLIDKKVVYNTSEENYSEKTLLECYLETKYISLYPHFSNFLNYLFSGYNYSEHSWIPKEDKDYDPVYYYNKIESYQFESFQSSHFYSIVPVFSGWFLPNIISYQKEIELRKYSTLYEYECNYETLCYILMFYKNFLENPSILKNENNLKEVHIILDMAYTNLKQRNLLKTCEKFFNDLDLNIINEFHPKFYKQVDDIYNSIEWYFVQEHLIMDKNTWKNIFIDDQFDKDKK